MTISFPANPCMKPRSTETTQNKWPSLENKKASAIVESSSRERFAFHFSSTSDIICLQELLVSHESIVSRLNHQFFNGSNLRPKKKNPPIFLAKPTCSGFHGANQVTRERSRLPISGREPFLSIFKERIA